MGTRRQKKGVDSGAPKDALSRLKVAYLEEGGKPDNRAHGWVRADV
jgi:hypothetical protein